MGQRVQAIGHAKVQLLAFEDKDLAWLTRENRRKLLYYLRKTHRAIYGL